MIPKIIHLCWLSGDPFPPLVEKCINSWKSILPDYEIMLWDLNRFDINSSTWVKEAFDCKKYAFAADYIRFFALFNFGGIYLDADVEVIKSFNPLLYRDYFMGEDSGGAVEAAVIGVSKGSQWIKDCLDYYNNKSFIKSSGNYDMTPVTMLIMRIAKKYGLELMSYTTFSPKDYSLGRINLTNNTFCIHHYDGKWVDNGAKAKVKHLIHRAIYFLVGRKNHNAIIKMFRPFIGH